MVVVDDVVYVGSDGVVGCVCVVRAPHALQCQRNNALYCVFNDRKLLLVARARLTFRLMPVAVKDRLSHKGVLAKDTQKTRRRHCRKYNVYNYTLAQ